MFHGDFAGRQCVQRIAQSLDAALHIGLDQKVRRNAGDELLGVESSARRATSPCIANPSRATSSWRQKSANMQTCFRPWARARRFGAAFGQGRCAGQRRGFARCVERTVDRQKSP